MLNRWAVSEKGFSWELSVRKLGDLPTLVKIAYNNKKREEENLWSWYHKLKGLNQLNNFKNKQQKVKKESKGTAQKMWETTIQSKSMFVPYANLAVRR